MPSVGVTSMEWQETPHEGRCSASTGPLSTGAGQLRETAHPKALCALTVAHTRTNDKSSPPVRHWAHQHAARVTLGSAAARARVRASACVHVWARVCAVRGLHNAHDCL